mgnify:CR=1 FL=1
MTIYAIKRKHLRLSLHFSHEREFKDMKIFIINMAKFIQRRAKMQHNIDELPEPLDIEFIEGVDGDNLTDSEITRHTRKLRGATTKGEAGRALSFSSAHF